MTLWGVYDELNSVPTAGVTPSETSLVLPALLIPDTQIPRASDPVRVGSGITPTTSPTFTPSVTATATKRPASVFGDSPQDWDRSVAQLRYERGSVDLGWTYDVIPAPDGVISINLYSPELPHADDSWLGGEVSGVWPVAFGDRQVRILGDCSHPCIVYVLDEFGSVVSSEIWGHIDIVFQEGMIGEGWVVVKPAHGMLDRVNLRIGPLEGAELMFPNPSNGIMQPNINGITAEQQGTGKWLMAIRKPIGTIFWRVLDVPSDNHFVMSLPREDADVWKDDQVDIRYIIPITLTRGLHDVRIKCVHRCSFHFLAQNGTDMRVPIAMQWGYLQGPFDPIYSGYDDYLVSSVYVDEITSGWILVDQMNSAGDIGIELLID